MNDSPQHAEGGALGVAAYMDRVGAAARAAARELARADTATRNAALAAMALSLIHI